MDNEMTPKTLPQPEHVHLTSTEINNFRKQLTDLVIAPYDSSKSKGVGYNLSLSEMVYSITYNRLVPICREAPEVYFYIKPHETVLALSHEYVKTSNTIAGSFHSRVRMTSQGIGSISTTLDPNWSGMLLFSLNNPTRKKIKVTISIRSEGIVKTQAISTLIAWMTPENNAKKLDLCLDNPPMRTDIWGELAAKPLKLMTNKRYQKFRNLVNKISTFKPAPSQSVRWALYLSELLTELEIAFSIKKSEEEIKSILCRIKNLKNVPNEIQKRISSLLLVEHNGEEVSILTSNESILEKLSNTTYQDRIELTQREVDYQLLCDQIDQIHALISKEVPTSWKNNFMANIWWKFIRNLGNLVATIIILLVVFYGQNTEDMSYWSRVLLAFIPFVVTILVDFFSKNK